LCIGHDSLLKSNSKSITNINQIQNLNVSSSSFSFAFDAKETKNQGQPDRSSKPMPPGSLMTMTQHKTFLV